MMPTDIDAQSDIEAAHPQAPIPPAKVLRAVEEIVNSRLFRTSPQCQKLLRYVVVHTLEGKEEELKERVIGSEVFGRPQDYNTSDDPVVRTRAADVRKRLAVFYQEEGAKAAIRITMPSGSYRVLLASLESSSGTEASAASVSVGGLQSGGPPEILAVNTLEASARSVSERGIERESQRRWRRSRWIALAAACALVLVIVAGVLVSWSWWANHPRYRSFAAFWAPLGGGSRPPIIYIGSSAVYRLTGSYIERYQAIHPGFKPEQNGREFTVPLSKGDVIDSSDLVPDERSFVTVGDVAAAVSITSMLAERKQPYDLRVGRDVVFGDFRTTPVILIGAFNNSWTIELNDTLCFTFGADNSIRETQGQRRVWRTVRDAQGIPHEDYALISRQISSKSGKFVFTVAGLDLTGTRAAAEFVRDPARLDAALQKLPSDWQDQKLQLVLHTNVLDDIPSGTQVAASCVQ
jgi:hypothetical protein